jgi:hypothetical protein
VNLKQAGTPGLLPLNVRKAVRHYSSASIDARGAIFTRREVVDFILDLVGYTEDCPLATLRLLEPAAGHADFLIPVVGRLVRSYVAHGGNLKQAQKALGPAIRAFDAHAASVDQGRAAILAELGRLGVGRAAATALAAEWLTVADFLLTPIEGQFEFVVGNPPYVRQELIPDALLTQYRSRFRTLYDRADLYIPFFERSLDHLAPGGKLGFICTDRWTKNKYGGPLRAMIAQSFDLTHFVDLVNTPAFVTEVLAYPAITVIERRTGKKKAKATRVAHQPSIEKEALDHLARDMTATKLAKASNVTTVTGVVNHDQPWILHQPDQLNLVRRLEETLPLLEVTGCKVGIGVATGNDGVYIGPMDQLDVEPSRKLPLVRTQDIRGGTVNWHGMGVLNPFAPSGQVIRLEDYPRFATYIQSHASAIKARNVAKRNPDRWFRTIDRIYPELVKKPKLLIPDIKGDAHVVYDAGDFYPHHNLYYITSDEWDLRALQALLMSGIARLFVAAYSTKMSGGFLRFQAQYLRRIRVPHWKDVPAPLREALKSAAISGNKAAANDATAKLYGLDATELALIAST